MNLSFSYRQVVSFGFNAHEENKILIVLSSNIKSQRTQFTCSFDDTQLVRKNLFCDAHNTLACNMPCDLVMYGCWPLHDR